MSNELTVTQNFDVSSDIESTQKMCAMLMKTKHFSKMGEEGIFSILCKAKSMGLNPMDALNGQFYMVNGKLGMSSEMMASLIRKAGHSISKDPKSTDNCCILNGKRKDNGDTWQMKFSIDDAKRAGIYKNMWEKYPQAMLYNRCLSFLARQLFPDVIQGVSYTKEELDEISDSKKQRFEQPMAEIEYQEIKEVITTEQAESLGETLAQCDPAYLQKVWKTLRDMIPPIKDLREIPVSIFDRLMSAALKNRESYQPQLAKTDSETQEIKE